MSNVQKNQYRKVACIQCGASFLSTTGIKKGKKYCSKECKTQGFNRSNLWIEKEINVLKNLSDLMPKYQIAYEFEKIRKVNEWIKRSHFAIMMKLNSLELDHSPRLSREYYTITELSQILNINPARINRNWRLKGLEYAFIKSPRVNSINIWTLKKYAANRPRDFYGIPLKKLNIIFRDMGFSKEVFELAFADSFSRCFCIVRLEGGVFESVGDAADKLVLGIATIEQAIKRESAINAAAQHQHRGETHNLVKLNYPKYLAPEGYEKEFNELAGNILIELYREYKKIQGYSKLGIQVIAVRQAVNIALVSFRSYFTDKSLGVTKKPVEMIAIFWQDKYIKTYTWHLQVNNFSLSRNRIARNLRQRVYYMFAANYSELADYYFSEFTDFFISKYSETYLIDQYLPTKYPQNKYISSDIWLFVECLSLAKLRKNKNMSLALATAITFIRNRQPESNYNPDWIDHNYHSEEKTTSEIEIIVEGLDMLNLEESYKQMCHDYVQAFCNYGDSYKVKEKLKISSEMEKEIIGTLKQAAMPF